VTVQLFTEDLTVVNVGLASFGENVTRAGGTATTLDWRPPAGGDPDLGWDLARLLAHPDIEHANAVAFARYQTAQPRLVDVQIARDAIPAMAEQRLILHAGPPIAWADMCGPVQGAIIGAILYEGWAPTSERAQALAASGDVTFAPCHHYGAVGPMAGVISPSMPLWVVTNAAGTNRAFSNFNEGLGKVLRFGANSPEVLERLHWMGSELFDTVRAGVASSRAWTSNRSSLKPCTWATRCTTATRPPPDCCSSGWCPPCSRRSCPLTHYGAASSSSPATTTSS